MKALIQTTYGEPEQALQLVERPDEYPRTGQVVIGMEAAVVHMADVHTVRGQGKFRKALPRTPGYEGVGRVLAVASDVTSVAVGDRVFAPIGCGTHRERIAVSASSLVPAPAGPAEQLALLALNPAGALMILQDFATLAAGDWIVQNAANSTLGRLVMQLANQLKLRVVNVVRSAEVAEELQSSGAAVVLLDDEQLPQRVSAVTQGAPIPLGLDAVGGQATTRIAMCLAENGTVVNHGAMSGEACQVPHEILAGRNVRLIGLNPARHLARYDAEKRKALYELLGEWIAAGRLQARIAAVYPIEKAVEAYRHTIRVGDKRYGKVVIRFDESPIETVAPRPADQSEP